MFTKTAGRQGPTFTRMSYSMNNHDQQSNQQLATRQVHELAAEFGIGPGGPEPARRIVVPERPDGPAPTPGATQLSLL
ncbi:hypothetical protein ACODT5_10175 [Streptomyces sp. 5.8]|uniref:hypothetical protein n=1 Tax=Streptomyces sp. 5.8 TaxID=3406571 RepID=UPI003BB77B9A